MKAVTDAKDQFLFIMFSMGTKTQLFHSLRKLFNHYVNQLRHLTSMSCSFLILVSQMVSFQATQFQFIHFITQMIDPTTVEVEAHNYMYLSLCLFYLIYEMKPETGLLDFVGIINTKRSKAKPSSNNNLLPVSMFLQSPTFKYFDYSNLENFLKYGQYTIILNEAEPVMIAKKIFVCRRY